MQDSESLIFTVALSANDPVCGGAVRMFGVPSACRKVLSGSRAAGWLAATVAARHWSLYVTTCDLVTVLAMSVSWSRHIWRKFLPGGFLRSRLESQYKNSFNPFPL